MNMDDAGPANTSAGPVANAPRIQQPKPQALPSRSGPSSILVSPRQKGNPILNVVRSVSWEYSDIPADYVLGATTCALFLSLKYHRLHPEYIYNRIRDLRGQYNLRILLTMVDIENHEESLRELSKTSIVSNVTVMLCWSAQEAGRYLELFKTFEHAAPTSIRAQQSSTYADKLVEFITVPRSINKTDAIGLVSNFGSVRTAVNAMPEEIGLIAGWGEKKVQQWSNAVREPFRTKQATGTGNNRNGNLARSDRIADDGTHMQDSVNSEIAAPHDVSGPFTVAPNMETSTSRSTFRSDADKRYAQQVVKGLDEHRPGEDEEEEMRRAEVSSTAARTQKTNPANPGKRRPQDEEINEDIMAALNKLRQQ